ncbi:MerR family transcriptional regulator [Lacticaseibacillus hulanensis]|uniref:MerR family transcriptional regulator n=1 Tax=Lacticaseibacillus hulanensis TaxID=2493111 RepID=UPI000FD96862|nr:MerR family transcriptional regulator [Lacticaseibacillus hulanensis]
MADDDLLRRRAVLPIGTVMNLTTLTARQIRYFEEQGLVKPLRNAGNHRMYSLNDVDSLIGIVNERRSGMSLADIKRVRQHQRQQTSDAAARRALRDELFNQRFGQSGSSPYGQNFH